MTTPAPGLIVAFRDLLNNSAWSGNKIVAPEECFGAIESELAALPPDAVIVPRSLLLRAANQCEYEDPDDNGPGNAVARELRQAAATQGAQT